jgi:hypothetical protein
MKKLMIASPCHHGKVDTHFTLALIQSLYILDHARIQTVVLLPTTGSILAKERNQIVTAFMKSDCTHLLMVDNDLSWDADAPLKFLNSGKDFIAGVYPARSDRKEVKYIFIGDTNDNGSIKNEGPLLKMLGVPAGFVMVTKKCIETMQKALPELYYKGIDIDGIEEDGYVFFNTELEDGKFWGEDYVFCRRATKSGINIWCDPSIYFNHAGTHGRLSDILTDKPPLLNNNYVYRVEK